MTISMANIFQEGKIYSDDQVKTIYLTTEEPLVYDANKWMYKEMPAIKDWKQHMEMQQSLHRQQYSDHLAFTFPENTPLSQLWLDEIKSYGFELGCMELYAIEAKNIRRTQNHNIDVKFVTNQTLEDYIKIYRQFSEPFGLKYTEESIRVIRNQFRSENKSRIIAYDNHIPVGILDLIITEKTVEIDGFGVLEDYQRRGIGKTMQSFVADVSEDKVIILIADGEDSAKHMYIKQGYIFISYCYQILKEQA
ncbi:GNAT family N-acetyltransferase [Staphylococcus shinii]|uniref:GNAT family N-acetyltransferase n=1 Tax=Staphylococcus shinii TaxID=2912228 RepID=UPI0018EAC52F|nr:GNAT family N-acetyltransferase [Staphylococcus shinii]